MKVLSKNEYSMNRKNIDGDMYLLENDESKNLHFPFLLYVPKECEKDTNVIFSCPTPRMKRELSFMESIDDTILQNSKNISPISRRLSTNFHLPIIIPIIPRIAGLDTSYLGSGVYHNDFREAKKYIKEKFCNLKEEDLEYFKDVHKQVCTMMSSALDFLRELGYNSDSKVIMEGYSAGSKFANFFTVLHPELVKMVIGGGTGGLNIIPLKEYNGYKLNYPVGINDLPEFDLEEFKQIQQFYYIGSEDINDPALPKCVMDDKRCDECGNKLPLIDENGKRTYIIDEMGNYQARFSGLYADYDINVINKGVSEDIQKRFDIEKDIYEAMGINVEFRKYPANHVSIWEQEELYEDVLEQYKRLMSKEYKK